MKVITKQNLNLRSMQGINIELLVNLSDIDERYINSDDDIKSGEIMILKKLPNTTMALIKDSVLYLYTIDLKEDIEEGIHFQII